MKRSITKKLALVMVFLLVCSVVQTPSKRIGFVSEAFAENLPENAQEENAQIGSGQEEEAQIGSGQEEEAQGESGQGDNARVESARGENSEEKPAVPFYAEETFDNAVVRVDADPGVFPEGAYMTATPITGDRLTVMEREVLAADPDTDENEDDLFSHKKSEVILFDIVIYNSEGREIQPDNKKGKVRVSIIPRGEEEPEEQKLFCLEDNGEVSFLNAKEDEDGALTAEAKHFSTYGIRYNVFVEAGEPIKKVTKMGGLDLTAWALGAAIVDNTDLGLSGFEASSDGTVYKFENGREYVGFDSGLVLDTSGLKPGKKDPELESLLPEGARYGGDTSSITISKLIDTTPVDKKLSFKYVFASSEFNQPEKYNDIAGVFIRKNNGPWTNYLKLSNGRPMTINNLRAGREGTEMNNGQNTDLSGTHSYFRAKNIGNGFTTNGVSSLFTIYNIPVKKGDKLDVKFVIADVSDTDRDSYLFIDSQSLTFNTPMNRVDYYDSNGDRIFYYKYEMNKTFTIEPLPENFDLGGRRFLGWKDYGASTRADNSNLYQPGDETDMATNNMVMMVGQFEPVKATVRIKLTKDGQPWTGYPRLRLLTDYKAIYMSETATPGIYEAGDVPCGSYTLQNYDGNIGTITVNGSGNVEGQTQYDYKTLRVTTRLDGEPEYVHKSLWDSYLKKGEKKYNLWSFYHTGAGVFDRTVPVEAGAKYQVFIDCKDTGKTVEQAEGKDSTVVDYTTLRVTIHNDEKWTDADVKLKDSSGKVVSYLDYNAGADAVADTDAVYEARCLVDEEAGPYKLFVGNLDTGITMSPTLENSKKELTFYTATLTVNGLSDKLPSVTIYNGTDQKELKTTDTGAPYCYSASYVFKRVNNEEELPYRIVAKGLPDIDPDTDAFKSTVRNKTLTYHKVSYYGYRKNDSDGYDPVSVYSPYVRHGKVISPYGLWSLKGFTALGWTTDTEQWTPETAAATPPNVGFFDFTQEIVADTNLYAWYDKPEVKINGIVQCDENGTLGATGWYRMPNASITGFDTGERAVRYLEIATNNATAIKIKNAGGITTNPVGDTSGTIKTISGKNVTIDFGATANISMAEAQSFLRNNVLIQPATGDHTVTVTVRDSEAKYESAVYATDYEDPTGETWKSLPTDYQERYTAGAEYHQNKMDGLYYVISDINRVTYMYSPLAVKDGETAKIYIKSGKTLRSGYNVAGSPPFAGINVKPGSNLVIYGGGKLEVSGTYGVANKNGASAGIGGNGGTQGNPGGGMGTLYMALGSTDSDIGTIAAGTNGANVNGAHPIGGGGAGNGSNTNGSRGTAYFYKGSKIPAVQLTGTGSYAPTNNTDGYAVVTECDTKAEMLLNDEPAIPHWKIRFLNPGNSTVSNSDDITYYHGTVGGTTFELPAYVPSETGQNFLGWQLIKHASPIADAAAADSLTADQSNINTLFQPGKTFTIPEEAYGEIKFRAVVETITGVTATGNDNRNFPGTPAADLIHTYKAVITVDGTVSANRGAIKIGDQTVTADEDGIYTLYTTEADPGIKNITIGGEVVEIVRPDDTDPVEIRYETIKVSVKGCKPNQVKLYKGSEPALTAGPALNEEACDGTEEPEDGYLWQCERRQQESNYGPFKIYVDGEDTGVTVSYGSPATVTFHTLTAKVTPVGAATDDIRSLELKKDGEPALFLTKQDDEGSGENAKAVFTITGLERDKTYTVYINGEATAQTAHLNSGTINLTYTRYTTTVVTKLDGTAAYIGDVKLGDDPMIQNGDGTYTLILSDNTQRDLYVGDVKVKEDVTPGESQTVEYFTVSYNKSGVAEYSESETGTPPTDDNRYLKGATATLLDSNDLSNGAMAFAGWKIGEETEPRAIGTEITVNNKITAKAAWSGTDLNDSNTEVTVGDNWFVYNRESQKPAVSVSRNGTALEEGRDYELSYLNTNGGAGDTTHAGDITITVTGKGDYEGSFNKDPLSGRSLIYSINAKDLSLAVTGENKEYDGTTDITLNDAGALTGLVDGDDVTVNAGTKGKLKTVDVGENLPVTVDVSNLTGNDSSNYSLRPADPVLVNVTKRTLSSAMFEVADQAYTGAPLTPELTLKDIKDASVGNILRETDYDAVYSDNQEMGTAKITITATVSGNYKDPATGPIELHFSIAKGAIDNYTAPTAGTLTYNGRNQELVSGGATTKGRMLYSTSASGPWSETVPVGKDAGSYNVFWMIDGGDNYNDVESQEISGITIGQKEVELQWDNATFKYNGEPQSPSVNAVNIEDGDSCTITVSVAGEHTNAGDYSAEATGISNSNYKLPSNKTQSFTILPNDDLQESTLAETQRVKAAKPVYDGHEHELVSGPNASPGHYNGVSYRIADGTETDASWSDNIPKGINGGEYNVQVRYNAADGNYADLIIDLAAPIIPAPLTVTAKPCTITYGETASNNGVSYNGFVNGEDESVLSGRADYEYTYNRYDDAGNYKITPKGLTSGNYDISFEPGTFTVIPKEVGFTWGSTSLTYNGSEQAPEVSLEGLVNNDKIEAKISGSKKDAGKNYSAVVTGLKGSKAGNYILTGDNLMTDYTIDKAPSGAKVSVYKKLTYSGEEQELVSEGEASGGTLYYAVTREDTEPAEDAFSTEIPKGKALGTFYVWYLVKGDKNHYDSPVNKAIVIMENEHTGAEGEKTYTISGKLYIADENGNPVPLKDGTIILTRGGKKPVAETVTDSEGRYVFVNIPEGSYNLVASGSILTVSADEIMTKTIMVTVDSDMELEDIILTSVRVSSKVVVKEGTGEAVVEGADAVAEEMAGEISGSGSKAEVVVTVEKKDKKDAENAEELTQFAVKESGMEQKIDFYDLSIEMIVDGGESVKLHETKSILMFMLSYKTEGRRGFAVFRNHEGETQKLEALQAMPDKAGRVDGTFFVGDSVIYIFSSRFSTYAIAYTEGASKISLDVGDAFLPDSDIITDEDGYVVSPLPVPSLDGFAFDGYFTPDGRRITDGEGYFVDENGNRVDRMEFDGDTTLIARFKTIQEQNDGNTSSIVVNADGETYTMTFTDRIIYDSRKHMAYPDGKTVKNTKRKSYDLKVVITDHEGKAINPALIKVRTKKNKNAGTGIYTVKVKGKKYKALNKSLKSKETRAKLIFNIERLVFDTANTSVQLNKSGKKVKKVIIKDSDGFAHKLTKKDYTVESFDTAAKTVVVSGKRNTDGKVTVSIK